jgi:hypothetical protein
MKKMWRNRKARFTFVMMFLIGANLVLWFYHQVLGYTVKDNPGLLTFVFIVDLIAFIGFAFMGLLTGWLLAFRPEVFIRSIERSMAKRNSN